MGRRFRHVCMGMLVVLAVVGLVRVVRCDQTAISTSPPMCYTPNVGQWDDAVLLRVQCPEATMWITKSGMDYQFVRRELTKDSADETVLKVAENCQQLLVRSTLVGATMSAPELDDEVLNWRCNYFLGNDSSKWRSDVRSYYGATFKNVYPGIDLKYYFKDHHVAYDFLVAPGADPGQIRVQFPPDVAPTMDGSNNLVIKTDWTDIIHSEPVSYAEYSAPDGSVQSAFRINDDKSIGFSVTNRPRSSERLVIDPGIIFSTFVGGSGQDIAYECSSSWESIWIAGATGSANYPTATPFQGSLSGNSDAFVTKLNSSGSAVYYSTYLGGSGSEAAYGLYTRDGLAHICGYTTSSNFPLAAPLDNTLGGTCDAFVSELAVDGTTLRFSTYLGGTAADTAKDIYLALDRSIFVTGTTLSSNFPTTNGCWDNTYNGSGDVFAVKYSTDGAGMAYSTYIGGTNSDEGVAITADPTGRAWITGYTYSSDFWTTTNAFDQTYNGSIDAFVFRLSSSGGFPVYSTFLGGTGADYGKGICADSLGYIFLCGRTTSSGFPVLTAYDASYNGLGDAFITKFDTSGVLRASTFLGGTESEDAEDIVLQDGAAVWATGATLSGNFPTVRANDPLKGGMSDMFVAKLSYNCQSLSYSSFFGGSNYDEPRGICRTGSNEIVVAGDTYSSDFYTYNPWDPSFNGGTIDCFVMRIKPQCCVNLTGNVDCDPYDGVDISDFSRLLDFLYISFAPLCCYEEANCDGVGGIDISDLTALEDYLYGSGTLPAACQ
jgi:hypothetical protein